jgi:hypothetical protein
MIPCIIIALCFFKVGSFFSRNLSHPLTKNSSEKNILCVLILCVLVGDSDDDDPAVLAGLGLLGLLAEGFLDAAGVEAVGFPDGHLGGDAAGMEPVEDRARTDGILGRQILRRRQLGGGLMGGFFQARLLSIFCGCKDRWL